MGITVNGVDQEVLEPGIDPEVRGYPGHDPRREVVDGLLIDRDVPLRLRDGVTIYTHI